MAVEIFPRATTYEDESVRHDRETGKWFCCVTSDVASFVEWVRAEIEWQGVLDAFAVSESHLTDFMARKKEFDNDSSNSKRDQFMERLCTIPSERPIMGVGCAISQVDWEDGLSASLRAEWEDPYYFCLYGMLSLIRTEVLVDRRYPFRFRFTFFLTTSLSLRAQPGGFTKSINGNTIQRKRYLATSRLVAGKDTSRYKWPIFWSGLLIDGFRR